MKPTHDSPQPKNATLTARVPSAQEVKEFDAQLAAHHYLGAGRPVGDYLRQVIELDGRVAALLVWGPSCYSLKDRDRWSAWNSSCKTAASWCSAQKASLPIWLPKRWGRPCVRCPANGGNTLATARSWPKVSPIRSLTQAPLTRPATGNRWA